MTSHLPPVPPAGRSPKGGQSERETKPHEPQHHAHDTNTDEQGQAGNTHQNTTHQGYQQDR